MSNNHIPALLLAQGVYAAAAAGYHVISIRETRSGRRPLHSEAGPGRLFVIIAYAASLGLGLAGLEVAYRVAMAAFIVVIGYGGLLVHLPRGPSDYYRSRAAWAGAIGINIVGLILNMTALLTGP